MTDDKLIGAEIGKKIREIRLKKGLTQKELAGEKITRNMLSLIESGTSCPSLGTLLYLSEQLAVPVGYFFTSSPEAERSFHKSTVIEELKRSFGSGEYLHCGELCAALPAAYADDEIAMIAALSHLRIAVSLAEQYQLKEAALHLTKANDYSNRTIYLDPSFRPSVEYYTMLFGCLNTTDSPDPLMDLAYASAYVPFDMILYFIQLNRARQPEFPGELSMKGVYKKHIDAVILSREGKNPQALKLLKELSQDSALPYFMRYRVLCDLETCANLAGDLRGAYVSARKKLELLQANP